LRFSIPVTYSNTVVNISKCPANLQISIPLIHFVVVSDHTTNSLRNILKHQVKIKFILFSRWEEAIQRYNIRVVQKAHSCNSRFLYLLSWRTFFIATVSPVSKHFVCRKHNNKSKLSTHHKHQTFSNSKMPNRDYIKD